MTTTAISLMSSLVVTALGTTSGLKEGEMIAAFHPTHVSGPLANSTNCFPCTFKQRPQAQVWVNGDSSENVAQLAQFLTSTIKKHKDHEFKAMIVVLSDEKNFEASKKAAARFNTGKDLAVAVLSKNDDAVKNYKINLSSDVKNTIVVYKDWKVAKSFVNLKADKAGLKALSGAIDSIAK